LNVFYVYIFETTSKDGKKRFYTGYTIDLLRRGKEHRSGRGAKFCRGKINLELKYFETYTNRKEAMKRELEIKTFSRKQKKELINSIYNN
jgi:putative endonuclease